jgi:hypothetical protein
MSKKALNDAVQMVFLSLVATPPKGMPDPHQPSIREEFREFISATHDMDAREGSLAADDFSAALMLRHASVRSIEELSAQEFGAYRLVYRTKLAHLVQALHVVMRRYGVGRGKRWPGATE